MKEFTKTFSAKKANFFTTGQATTIAGATTLKAATTTTSKVTTTTAATEIKQAAIQHSQQLK